MKRLYEAMEASHDRLCFIRYQEDGAMLPKWYLVQVDLDATDPDLAWKRGTYRCKWLVKCHTDSLRWQTWDCWFWPDVREVGKNNILTSLVAVAPHSVEGFLRKKQNKKYVWSEDEVCLAEHLLVGPFNFVHLPDLEAPKRMEDR